MADLQSPGPAAMPPPARLSAPESFSTVGVTLDPPLPADQARSSPAQAWTNAEVDKRKDASYQLVLARLSAQDPSTIGPGNQNTPMYQKVLVWAVISRHVAGVSTGGGATAYAPGETSTVPTVSCSFNDGVDATDATTGQHLSAWSWGT